MVIGRLSAAQATLEVDESGQLSFTPAWGTPWRTDGPLLLVRYYNREHPWVEQVAVPSKAGHQQGTDGTLSFSGSASLQRTALDAQGITLGVTVHGADIQLSCRLEMEPDGRGFRVSLNDDAVVEAKPNLHRLLAIEVLPDYGAARTGEEGYLVLPNWSGCQTMFNKSYPREVRQVIYSPNSEWANNCNMALFGIVRGHGTLCGMITQGDLDARLISRVHWESHQLNGSHPELVYRWHQEDELIAGRREVRYAFAPTKNPCGEGYAFCARQYRTYLRAERGLQTWNEKEQHRPPATDYLSRFFLKIFMAYKEPHAEGKGTYHPTCTFDEAREILAECQRRGMRKLTACLVGWGQDGHDGMPPTRFPVDERLGGEPTMRRLVSWCHDHDILLCVHDSYGGAYSCSPEFDTRDLIRHRTGEYWESIIWSGGQSHVVCPGVYLDKHVRRDVPRVRGLGLYGHHHIDALGTFELCYSPEHPLKTRVAYVAQVRRMLRFVQETLGSISTEYPFGPYFDLMDGYFHSYQSPYPWHRNTSVGRHFLDASVPLLEIVLHGSVNCLAHGVAAGPGMLEMVDAGLSPQFEVAARPAVHFGIGAYAPQADLLARLYAIYYGENGIARLTARAEIVSRRELVAGVNETRYSNGVSITVNRNDVPAAGMAPASYQVVDASPATPVAGQGARVAHRLDTH